MKTIYTPAAEEQHKLGAWLNANTTNYANKSHYTAAQVLEVDRVAQYLKTFYTDATMYITYRKTKAVIKFVTDNTHLHTVDKQLAEYVQHLATQNIHITHRPNTSSVGYNIPKK
tara:strand:+ start:951 stop:1292 length:342 start_codon:yes stop_codon:yes gene_type:complete